MLLYVLILISYIFFYYFRLPGAGITAKEFGRRFRKALSVPFLLNQVCSSNLTEFVTAYASSLGCSEKTFFFPLLTCTAACMGNDSYLELSNLWHEPTIIWTLLITPQSLLRMDVSEHLKQELLRVQNEMWNSSQQEDTKNHLKKFVFDSINLEQLHEMLKLSNGYGLGIYNSVRSLHKCISAPEDADIMHRLHYGLGWFTDSRVTKGTLTKTRVNLSIISTPTVVQQTLNAMPNFYELFHQCFLTACAEESHVKFSQLSTAPETEKLREIFLSVMKLHSSGAIVYKLGSEATEKFEQIHDELTDKAKQMVRKNVEYKVFQPILSYLGRLSCVLHVLDNIIESINYKVPISSLTWNTEISAATVWHARELLSHLIEQRHSLIEPTTLVPVQKVQRIDLVGANETSPRIQRSPQTFIRSPVGVSPRGSPIVRPIQSPVIVQNYVRPVQRSPRFNTGVKRNIMNAIGVQQQPVSQFDALLNQKQTPTPITPCITSISSAGIIVPNPKPVGQPRQNISPAYNLPSALSVSVSNDNASQPVLLSRAPFVAIHDLTNEDFLKSHKNSIKRILVHDVSQISPSRCVQLKLISDPTATDDSQKYSLGFARTFLRKLEKIGFGVCDGTKNGNLRHFLFKKKKFTALTNSQRKILFDLGISERDYNKCFVRPTSSTSQNGSRLVCLE